MKIPKTFRTLACLLAWPAAAPCSAAGDEATTTLGDLTQTYDGGGKLPSVTTSPPGLAIDWRFVDPAAPPPLPVQQKVFNNFPTTMALSYGSLSFAAQRTWGLGDYVDFGTTARNLVSVDVALVTWARAVNYPTLAAANPNGWNHPVTLTIYTKAANGALTFHAEKTQNIFVPWRPVTLPNGNPYLPNGYACRAHIPFPAGIVLPQQAMLMVSFNTQSTGFTPIGTPGPYNELNVAVVGNPPSVGTDIDPAAVLWVRENSWSYPTSGTPAPLFEVVASETPEPGFSSPPVNAGTYSVTATIDDPLYVGTATGTFTILPATAEIQIADLVQVADGLPKTVTVTTTPPSLSVGVLYAGSANPPSALGTYPVTAQITNPNYTGSATASLRLGHDLASWLKPWVDDLSLPASATGDDDDPEADAIVNLLEYAFALNPATAAHGVENRGLPQVEWTPAGLVVIYRKNLTATDLQFDVEVSDQLSGPADWAPADTTDSVMSETNGVQVIRALIPSTSGEPKGFARLRVVRTP